MAKAAKGEVPAKEQPQLFCVKCRTWKVTLEKDPGFFSSDAPADFKPTAWVCPGCRGAVPEANRHDDVAVKTRPVTQADIVSVEKYGPMRKITKVLEKRERSHRVLLECDHIMTAPLTAKVSWRCYKCRPKKGGK